ncbi:ATP-binding cassette domain-containing protein [Pseudohoeflea coraliihabitans]|uniref:ATP-binding cassette domain-containing protein n=1 Tax=Pseudohoeflea coraliihabitans TaxID=2860393 RepID=A0ABS6WLB9_9HYPH|nr:ATP-binding cassette domain-containing protein [Pseudohoeflea sp. DP4N28-3]MBW3096575.1 ATP-binding cassette domain-containing protein [Pseudohoeflea sp. DP4N28-3]
MTAVSSATSDRAVALQLEGVQLQLGTSSMHFDLSRPTGSVTAIMGPSGSGKSTLLNLIAGFLTADAGRILIEGIDVGHLPPARRGLSMVFQDNNLFAHLDIATNIGLGLDPHLKLTADQKKTIEAALERVGLQGFGRRLPGTLSGGERQRAALARAFARRQPLLLLDEPFDGLGPGLAADMIALMLEIRRDVGATVLMVTHDPDEAKMAAGHVLFLSKGRIIAEGAIDGFFERRDVPELARYLGTDSSPATAAQKRPPTSPLP